MPNLHKPSKTTTITEVTGDLNKRKLAARMEILEDPRIRHAHSMRRNDNILCAIMALVKELDEEGSFTTNLFLYFKTSRLHVYVILNSYDKHLLFPQHPVGFSSEKLLFINKNLGLFRYRCF